ncbi:SPL family radical SAM protein [Paenibacillus thalictri]|uniref:Radical SAM protein n=1 Tax=Paenibacillus thalictri TaxID=2527873 RepID=A0A4Q9DPG3_9BACL|nr:radical SAM protein [Paenibacillus thalictri]TBL78203.1 radical SAM protein [Paenibacillus thalictri]
MTKQVTFEPIRSKQALNPVNAPSMPFSWSLNPYRGCQHGCSFCYARSTHFFMGMDTDDTFQRHIFIKENAPDALEQQLAKLIRSKGGLAKLGKVAIGTATDPYQPIESKERVTRRCLELFACYGVPVSVTTRSPLVLRDLDLLKQIPDATVNLSISTLDSSVWRNFEPFTPSPSQRFKTLGTLVEDGIQAGIFMAPILPGITDSESTLQAFIQEAATYNPRFVMASYLRLSTRAVKVWFFQNLQQCYPELVSLYARWYAESGRLPGEYRNNKHQMIDSLLQQSGLTAHVPYSQNNRPADLENAATPVQLEFSF